MTRPRCKYNVEFCPKVKDFRPDGKSCSRDQIVELTAPEAEALRLKNVKGLQQIAAAKKMKVSQSSFQRVLASAYKKISQALIHGKEIKIKG